MTSTISTVRVSDAVKATLNAGLTALHGANHDPVEIVNAPPGVSDGSGKPVKPYMVIYPIPSAGGEPSMSDSFGTVDLEFQVRCIGLSRQQAEWVSEQARVVLVGRTAWGAYTYPMVPAGGTTIVLDRRIALFGGVSSDAPGTYEVNDSYYVTVS